MITKGICQCCGIEFVYNLSSGRSKLYCSRGCQKKSMTAAYKAPKKKKENDPKICEKCGKEYIPQGKNAKSSRFCGKECRLQYYRDNNLYCYNPDKGGVYKRPKKHINTMKDLAAISSKARAEGLTYGEYVVKYGL